MLDDLQYNKEYIAKIRAAYIENPEQWKLHYIHRLIKYKKNIKDCIEHLSKDKYYSAVSDYHKINWLDIEITWNTVISKHQTLTLINHCLDEAVDKIKGLQDELSYYHWRNYQPGCTL